MSLVSLLDAAEGAAEIGKALEDLPMHPGEARELREHVADCQV